MIFKNNKVYDVLKWITTVALPAVTAFYLALASIWGWPYSEQIGASLAALTAFCAAMLGVSSIQYKKELQGINLNEGGDEDGY